MGFQRWGPLRTITLIFNGQLFLADINVLQILPGGDDPLPSNTRNYCETISLTAMSLSFEAIMSPLNLQRRSFERMQPQIRICFANIIVPSFSLITSLGQRHSQNNP